MRKFYFFVFFVFAGLLVNAQSDRYWVGASGGSWTNGANWSLTSGGAGGAGAPTSVQNAIFDGYVGTVNFDAASITINALKIINSADVTLSTPVTTSRTVTINDGLSSNQDLRVDASSKLTLTTATGISGQFALAPNGALVDGTVILKGSVAGGSGGRIDASNATVSSPVEFNGTIELQDGCSNTAGINFKFNSGSFYIIKKSGGTIPAGIWDSNAEIQFLGLPSANTTSGPTFSGPPAGGFGRFVYNVATQSQTINLSLSSLGTIFNGDFRVLNTNGQTLRLSTTLVNVLVKGNLLVQGNSKVSMTNSATDATNNLSLTVNGDLNIAAGSFDLQENSGGGKSFLKLKGGLTIGATGTLTATGNGTTTVHEIEFLGTTAQPVSVLGSITGMPQFKINGAGLVASTNVSLPTSANSKLTLTAGNIDMGAFVLYVQNPLSAALSTGSASSHIIGKLRRATNSTNLYFFPVSNSATEMAAVKIYPAAATGSDYQVQFIRPNSFPKTQADLPSGVTSISNYYWDISRPSGALGADLNFSYGGLAGFAGSTDPATVKVLRWNGSSPWENLGGTDGGSNSIDVAGVTSFTQFALGSPAAESPLPVGLLNFSASRQNGAVNLSWTVAQEQDMKGYEVERSANGRDWTLLSTVKSLGNTASQRSYAFTDNGANGDKQYYRLRSIDLMGAAKLSNVVIVGKASIKAFAIAAVYPNPVVSKVTVQLQSAVTDNALIRLSDAQGKNVYSQARRIEKGTNSFDVPAVGLATGIYTLQITNGAGETVTQKIMKK